MDQSLSVLQSLCGEIKQRRRGVASILRLCQHLLDDRDTCNLNADHQPMQLIIVNLERRWEAIVMQAVQWQTRLQKKMGKESVSDIFFKYNGLLFFPRKYIISELGKCTHFTSGFLNRRDRSLQSLNEIPVLVTQRFICLPIKVVQCISLS